MDGGTCFMVMVVCLIVLAALAATKAALVAVNQAQLQASAEGGLSAARLVRSLVEQREKLAVSLWLTEMSAWVVLSQVVAAWWYESGPGVTTHWLALVLAVLAVVGLALLVRILPTAWAALAPEATLYRMSWMLRVLMTGLSWPVSVLLGVGRMLMRAVWLKGDLEMRLPVVPDPALTQALADMGFTNQLEQSETEMIQSVIGLGETLAREVMVPRIRMVCLPVEASFDEAVRIAIVEGHSRIPVYQDSSDNIVGLVYVKDMLGILQGNYRPERIPSDLIRPAYHVPETKKVDEMLKEMRSAKVHLAIVLDEFGGTAGLVTIEDILEEIVGEIHDEYDAEEELEIEAQPDGTLVVDGVANMDDVFNALGVKLPQTDFDTIGGFVVGLLGRAPVMGEEVTHDGVRLRIERVDNRHAARIRIWRRNTAPLNPELAPSLNDGAQA